MAQPAFLTSGDSPQRRDTKWFRWVRMLGQYQNKSGADPANNPRRTDTLRTLKEKLLSSISGTPIGGCCLATSASLFNGLFAYYRMEEDGLSNRVSSVAGAPDLVPTNAIGRSAGKSGFAADTEAGGSGERLKEVTNGNFDFTTDWAFAAWVDTFTSADSNADAFVLGYGGLFPAGGGIGEQGLEAGALWGLYYSQADDSLNFYALDTGFNLYVISRPAVNDFDPTGYQHVVLMYEAATRTLSFYFNGALVGTTQMLQPIASTADTGGLADFTMFALLEEGNNIRPLVGRIDEVAVYNSRLLTPDEIAALASGAVYPTF